MFIRTITRLTYFGAVALVLVLLVLPWTAATKSVVTGDADDALKAYLDSDNLAVPAGLPFVVGAFRTESYLANENPSPRIETPLALSTTYRGPPLV